MELVTECGTKYKKSSLRASWLEDLMTNLSLSENDIVTNGERMYIHKIQNDVNEYLQEAYNNTVEIDYDFVQ